MLNKLILLIHTLKYLKPIQILYQFKYRLFGFKKGRKPIELIYEDLIFDNYVFNNQSYLEDLKFRFLNVEKTYSDKIDWNDLSLGKLWNYNLNYFDFLNQNNFNNDSLLFLIDDYHENYSKLKDGLEPYPTSLRIINLIKYAISHNIKNDKILGIIVEDTYRLNSNLEYHLLANHLLENAFALWFSSHLIQDRKLREKSIKLLKQELENQIMNDGAHYELSPMYHNILLYRLLDSIQLTKQNKQGWNEGILNYLEEKASLMLGWIDQIDINKLELPYINDSTKDIAPLTLDLIAYAKSIGITPKKSQLSKSGFRVLESNHFKCIVDVSNINPTYQPGHSHADSLNYIVYFKGSPLIIDPGITTYENNRIRHLERSSMFHNVVTINNENSSKIWGAFRIGKRAKVDLKIDKKSKVIAQHNGYINLGVLVNRKWKIKSSELEITDSVNNLKDNLCHSHIHLHPKIKIVNSSNNKIVLSNNLAIIICGDIEKYQILDYDYSDGFNKTLKSKKIKIDFKNQISINIVDENIILN